MEQSLHYILTCAKANSHTYNAYFISQYLYGFAYVHKYLNGYLQFTISNIHTAIFPMITCSFMILGLVSILCMKIILNATQYKYLYYEV